MVNELEAEMNQDKYDMAQVSDINLDNGSTSGDMGLGSYAIKKLYSDFILVELLDMSKGFVVTKNGLRIPDTKVKSWRRAKVHLIGPLVAKYGMTKVGDIVTFPNDKGMTVGKTSYVNEKDEIVEIENALFLNEQRILSQLIETEEVDE